MAYSERSNPFGVFLTPWVKRLLIANGVVFLITLAFRIVVPYLAFTPAEALVRPWSLLTYMFVHGDFFHLFFNMLGLFFFGPVLEERWGSANFLKFYLIAGFGGALLSLIFPYQPIIGASAAVYGIMVAFAMYWPDNPIHVWGIFPVKAKWLVAFLVAMSMFYAVTGGQGGVAHLAHLGGAATAFLYLKSPWAPSQWGNVYGSTKKKAKRDWNPFRRRPRAVVDAQPKPAPRPRPAAVQAEIRALDEVDRILDKISEHGLGALTDEERRLLEEASRRTRSN